MTNAVQAQAQKMSRRLPPRRIKLSALKIFNPFAHGLWHMPRRPLVRFIPLIGGGERVFEATVLHDGDVSASGSLMLYVSFYRLFGRSLHPVIPLAGEDEGRECAHQTYGFFADPAREVQQQQRVYVKIPKGAWFARLHLERGHPQGQFSVATDFTLKRPRCADMPSYEEALQGRDEYHLRAHLRQCHQRADRVSASLILIRLIYLFGRYAGHDQRRDRAMLLLLETLDKALSRMGNRVLSGNVAGGPAIVAGRPPGNAYNYRSLLTPLPEGKEAFAQWVKCEATCLAQQLEKGAGAYLKVEDGPYHMERTLAAFTAGCEVQISPQETIEDYHPALSWLSPAERSYLHTGASHAES